MNASTMHRTSFSILASLVCFSMLISAMLIGLAQGPSADAAAVSTSRFTPSISEGGSPAGQGQFVVSGKNFKAGGRVYVAIYDQAGAQLFENRWVHASTPMSADQAARLSDHLGINAVASKGGEIHELFQGLCNVSAMTRAYDASSDNWSSWLTVEPKCAPTAAEIADDLDVSFRLPVAKPRTAGVNAIITVTSPGHESTAAIASSPVLLANPTNPGNPLAIGVTGLGFTTGKKVYVAVYDAMGAKTFPTRWVHVDRPFAIPGMHGDSPQAAPLPVGGTDGSFTTSFDKLCGANVMIRAYDSGSQAWSNFVTFSTPCHSEDGIDPAGSANVSSQSNCPSSLCPGAYPIDPTATGKR